MVNFLENKINKTKGDSYFLRDIPEGCKYCIEGSKVVLFMTGKCSRKCFYCPLSTNKKNSTKIYADEIIVNEDNDLLREAKLINAKGAGITGGDPLIVFDQTVKYIELLKNNFGANFHIHLYTTGQQLTLNRLERLIKSGLDEIRLHTEDFDSSIISLLNSCRTVSVLGVFP